jgi:hypothetical protein
MGEIEVAVLFVTKDSVYKSMPGCDCYDADRDAVTYAGYHPVVCHPPCRLWGKLSYFSTAPMCEKNLAVWAVAKVRECGGVLEHPAYSKLWNGGRLPIPEGLPDEYGGYTVQVDQFDFGHKAEKRTWLYICGCRRNELPEIPHLDGSPSHVIASSTQKAKRQGLKHVNKKDRMATPPQFAHFLVEIARRCARRPSFNMIGDIFAQPPLWWPK